MLADFTVKKEGLKASLTMTKTSKTWSLENHVIPISSYISLLKYALIVSDNSSFAQDFQSSLENTNWRK